jgi:hypothetical protein
LVHLWRPGLILLGWAEALLDVPGSPGMGPLARAGNANKAVKATIKRTRIFIRSLLLHFHHTLGVGLARVCKIVSYVSSQNLAPTPLAGMIAPF